MKASTFEKSAQREKGKADIFSNSLTFFDKGNGMTTKKASKGTKGKTYQQIIKEEAEGNVLEYHTDSENCLLFWEDLTSIIQDHFGEDISKSYDRSIQNEVIRKTLKDKSKLYFQIEGTNRFTLKSFADKVISLSALPQRLQGMIQKEVDREKKEGKDTMKHTLQKRVHIFNALIQLVSEDSIFLFPSRSNDTKIGGMTELLRWRLSAILSALKGGKTLKTFVFYMPKSDIADCKKSFGKCTSLLNKREA